MAGSKLHNKNIFAHNFHTLHSVQSIKYSLDRNQTHNLKKFKIHSSQSDSFFSVIHHNYDYRNWTRNIKKKVKSHIRNTYRAKVSANISLRELNPQVKKNIINDIRIL